MKVVDEKVSIFHDPREPRLARDRDRRWVRVVWRTISDADGMLLHTACATRHKTPEEARDAH